MYFDHSNLFLTLILNIYTHQTCSVKSIFSAANWFMCGLETLLLGGACATVAYTIGQFVDGLIASSE